MQAVYFYEDKTSKEVNKILKDDALMRISYIILDSNIIESDREQKGYFLYVQANPDELDFMEKVFKQVGVIRVTGVDEQNIINKVKDREENAASGMGMIFG